MCTRAGSLWLASRAGSITATPATVANQSRPSRAFHRPWPKSHSRFFIPSAVSKTRDATVARLPAATSSNACRETRKMPLLQVIQKCPLSSSSSVPTRLSYRPVLVVYCVRRPSL